MISRSIAALAWAAALSGSLASAARCDPAGLAFLEVPAGAAASALGGAYASRAEGVEAAFWNPAGLAGVHGIQVTASHYEFLQSLRFAHFAVARPAWGGGLAASLRAMYSEPIPQRDVLGNQIGTFGVHDLELALGYGRQLRRGLWLGGSAQIVRERIAESATNTYAVGGGAIWSPAAIERLRLSGSLHNLGPSAAYTFDGQKGQPVPLPTAVQIGASYATPLGAIDLRESVEARLTRGRPALGMLGLDASHPSGAALRIGLRVNDESTSLSYGAGFGREALRLDYAFVPYRLELGDTQRFSMTLQF